MLLNALKMTLHPPLALFVLAGLGWLIGRRRRRLGRALIATSAALLWLLSTPWVASAILFGLQRDAPLDLDDLPEGPAAIVVLGAGLSPHAPELGGPDVGPLTLVRLRYAARLARASSLPTLVAGGPLLPDVPPLGSLMADVLREEYGLTTIWRELRSMTTEENARLSAVLLRERDVDHVFLVTHAWHMPRARAAFERAGLRVTPAPTAFQPWPSRAWRGCIPSAQALRSSSFGLHEWIGRVWYALRASITPG